MTHEIPESHPLHRLFRGLTEATFLAELGIGDPDLVGYIAGLLARFVPNDGVWSIRDQDGQRIEGVAGMIAAAEGSADDERRRECHRHVGDFTLFWTGVYPESIARLQRASADSLLDYREQGKRSYLLASTYSSKEASLLRRLSHEFELCAFGLSRVRREWEREAGSGRFGGTLLVA